MERPDRRKKRKSKENEKRKKKKKMKREINWKASIFGHLSLSLSSSLLILSYFAFSLYLLFLLLLLLITEPSDKDKETKNIYKRINDRKKLVAQKRLIERGREDHALKGPLSLWAKSFFLVTLDTVSSYHTALWYNLITIFFSHSHSLSPNTHYKQTLQTRK